MSSTRGMYNYLYDKSDTILTKLTGLLCFQCEGQFGNKASCQRHHQLLRHIWVRSAGTTYFSENYFKATFSFHWISVLL